MEGKGGKDGAMVSKVKFGPYTVASGQTLTRNLVGGLNGASVPCRDCYVVRSASNLSRDHANHFVRLRCMFEVSSKTYFMANILARQHGMECELRVSTDLFPRC